MEEVCTEVIDTEVVVVVDDTDDGWDVVAGDFEGDLFLDPDRIGVGAVEEAAAEEVSSVVFSDLDRFLRSEFRT